ASGYRDTEDPNKIHIFAASAGGGGGTSFELVADRPVYWGGVGPQRRFFVNLGDSEEVYIEVTIPEPASIAMILLGGITILRRNKK
ncbi:MAG: PEP-CTERM sorting domain-containing protein, partial [Desulfobacterales bacterium]|nr:PEP-CTERM sorting domain-containing protein [Desulfobacterales bacterium]